MKRVTVPFGTEVRVKVLDVFSMQMLSTIVCEGEVAAGRKEAFICMNGVPTEAILPKVGEEGRIVFTQGGPMGGYWHYSSVNLAPANE